MRANLSKDIQCASSNTRPPMLDRFNFESWQQRIHLNCLGKYNGENILNWIDEYPFKMGKFRETLVEGAEGLPKDIYILIHRYTDAKDIWDNVKMLLEGSELTKDEHVALVKDLTLNEDNVFQDDQCDAFDSDVDEAPTTHTMFIANLSSADPIYDEVGSSYDSDILSKVAQYVSANEQSKVVNESLTAELPALYNGPKFVKTKHASAIVHNLEDTLELAETTIMKMLEKSKSTLWVDSKIKIAPPD
ncbi:hypothetical protein Tco_0854639 [Tanacetum coccineum]